MVPSDAPREQIEDVQRAFYAGWQSAITTLSTEVSPGDDLTDSDRSLMARISDELEAFWGALEDEP